MVKKDVKDTLKVGIGSLTGQYALGRIGSLPGMPADAQGTLRITGASLQLANVGQLAKTGMGLAKTITKEAGKTIRTKKTKNNKCCR